MCCAGVSGSVSGGSRHQWDGSALALSEGPGRKGFSGGDGGHESQEAGAAGDEGHCSGVSEGRAPQGRQVLRSRMELEGLQWERQGLAGSYGDASSCGWRGSGGKCECCWGEQLAWCIS